MTDRALIRVRRDDGGVADLVERLFEGEEPARFDPVIVGDEDPRPGRPIVERPCAGQEGPWTASGGSAGDWLAALPVQIATLGPGPLSGHVRFPAWTLIGAIAFAFAGGVGGCGRSAGRAGRFATEARLRPGGIAALAAHRVNRRLQACH
ncbi:MAG: hypothetical protein NVS9B8_14310 [Candidatus Limnocylindrales bacterium]